MSCYVIINIINTPVRAVMLEQTHPRAPNVCLQYGVSVLSPLVSRCKGTLNTWPTILFDARYFKEFSVANMTFLKIREEWNL